MNAMDWKNNFFKLCEDTDVDLEGSVRDGLTSNCFPSGDGAKERAVTRECNTLGKMSGMSVCISTLVIVLSQAQAVCHRYLAASCTLREFSHKCIVLDFTCIHCPSCVMMQTTQRHMYVSAFVHACAGFMCVYVSTSQFAVFLKTLLL